MKARRHQYSRIAVSKCHVRRISSTSYSRARDSAGTAGRAPGFARLAVSLRRWQPRRWTERRSPTPPSRRCEGPPSRQDGCEVVSLCRESCRSSCSIGSSGPRLPRTGRFPHWSPRDRRACSDVRCSAKAAARAAASRRAASSFSCRPIACSAASRLAAASCATAARVGLDRVRPRRVRPRLVRLRPCGFGSCGFGSCGFGSCGFGSCGFGSCGFGSCGFGSCSFGPCSFGSCSFGPCGFGPCSFGSCCLGSCSFARAASTRAASTRAASTRAVSDSCRLGSCRLDSCRLDSCRLDSCRLDSCRLDSCGLLPFGLQPCGLGPRRFLTSKIPPRCLRLLISRRRHRDLRARGAWRFRHDGHWHRRSGGHDPCGLVGPLHGDHVRRGVRWKRRVIGSIGAGRHRHSGRTWRGVWHGIGICLRICHWLRIGLRHDRCCSLLRGRHTRHEWCQLQRTRSSTLLHPCLLQRLRVRQDLRLRGCDLRRNDYDPQIGLVDPSILPWEAEAREPKSLATEDQAQQRHVGQQRERQRTRQPPALEPYALTVDTPLEQFELEPVPQPLLGHCRWRGDVWPAVRRAGRPDRATGQWACQSTSQMFENSFRSIVVSAAVSRFSHAMTRVGQYSIVGPCHESSLGRARPRASRASHQPSQALRPGRRRQIFSRPLHFA